MNTKTRLAVLALAASSAILSGCSIVLPPIVFSTNPDVHAPEVTAPSADVPAGYSGAEPILIPPTTVAPTVEPCREHATERDEDGCSYTVSVPAPEMATTTVRPPVLIIDRLPVQAAEPPSTTIETRLVGGKERLPNACVLVTRQDADGQIRTTYLDGRQLPCDPINFDPFAYLNDFGPWGGK